MATDKILDETQEIMVQDLHLVVAETVWPPYQTGKFIASKIMPQYKAAIKNKIVLDVGTGSGLIALKAGKLGAKKVFATDLNAKAVLAAQENWERNSLPPDKLDTFVSDALANLPDELEGKINLIISNPPVQPMLEINSNGKERDSAYDWNEAEKGGRAVLDSVIIDGLRFLFPGDMIITSTSTRHGWNQTQELLNSLTREGKIQSWKEIHRETHQLAPFYDKYIPLWLEMQAKDGDTRIWKNGKGWSHDFIVLELINC